MGLSLGVIQTGSENPRNPNASSFRERSIEWTLLMEEIVRKSAWTLHKHVHTISGSSSENRQKFFESSYEGNGSSPPMTTSKDREFIEDLGASLQLMSKSDLTPEEHATIRKSKGPSVVVSANGTTHTTEAATLYVYVWTSLFKFNH